MGTIGNYIFSFAFFWGVWLLVPILVDSSSVFMALIGTLLYRARFKKRHKLNHFPFVSILVPVYNCEEFLFDCLASLAHQSYPLDRLEVIVLDNGSQDGTFERFNKATKSKLNLSWHSIVGKGKAWALNSGIHLARGEYIINIDCDLRLDRHSVLNAISYLEEHKDIGAATGYLVISKPMKSAAPRHKVLGGLEFLEYCTVFGVGRSFQSVFDSLYTLSGAYSIFRREVLLKTILYGKDTVSEDTELTFQLYARAKKYKVVSIPSAIAYLFPIESWGDLYSQRLRWQRGQLEVSAKHQDMMDYKLFKLRGFSPTRSLMVDHTLAMPRLVWTAFLPILTLFGYPGWLITTSYLSLYVFYFFIELIWYFTAWLYAAKPVRERLLNTWLLLPLMPLYRVLLFYFRVGGFYYAISEPHSWNVDNPIEKIKAGIEDLKEKSQRLFK